MADARDPGRAASPRRAVPWVRHPNYTAAAVAALPLVHSAWLTAIVFSMANALALTARIRAENAALGLA